MDQNTAHDLHVVRTLAQHTPVRLSHDGKSVGQKVIERFARSKLIAEDGGHITQLRIAHRAEFFLQRFYFSDGRQYALDLTVAVRAEDLPEKSHILYLS